MRARLLLALAVMFFFAAISAAPAANTAVDVQSALAAAEAAEKAAGALKNQWTVTEDALTAAKKAAAAGDYDTAVRFAKRAEALAKASIDQANEQKNAWRAAVVR